MQLLGFECAILHSFLTQKARTKSISLFRNQKVSVFITTDLAARGIDIKTVDLVVNYDLPRDHKDFVHRVGRTARGGKLGLAVSLVTQYNVNCLKAIEQGIGEKMEKQEIDEREALKEMSAVIKAKKKAELDISVKGEDEVFEKMRGRKNEFREMLKKRKTQLQQEAGHEQE